ncbi:head maturation protease, ClpP-related [Rummeliibacillus stabekisii]|uniref:ATP-dependent Clp protease proteolytic subunit n=1 Tax=Rummeliibacillus stabekisii TaxID=241244 RepID=A0A143HA96_9BACL|nr:head maturation protease, ClpP-related [Rummeliibacillus stabekisii]AMW98446.1 Clp protease ClpP [Rummeliibacillus stabekisii]
MGNQSKKCFFDIKASVDGNSADVFIYGEITKWAWEEFGEMSSTIFKEKLDEAGDVETIHLYVNSPGGSVFEAIAMANMLKRHKAHVIAHVDALAASAASFFIMIADEIRMPSNSMLMIHNAWTWTSGNANELRKAADDLDRINQSAIQMYLDKAGDKLSEETLKELLDNETWLSADEAFNYGLCDVVEESNHMAASITDKYKQHYRNVPRQLQKLIPSAMSAEEKTLREQILADSKVNQLYLKTIL